jgi:hypothetical protein
MAAALPRERATAAGILAVATLLAAWIMFHRPPQVPVRIVEQTAAEPEAPTPQPPSPQDAPADAAMKFEIVELPAPAAPIAPPAPASQAAAASPAPPRVETARAEPVPEPPPPYVQAQETAPPPPPPPVVPLQPEARAHPAVMPLQAETPAQRLAAPTKPLLLLRPGDEKASATPLPVQPLHVETETPVSRETRPAPQPLKAEPPKAESRTPKIDAWVPRVRQRDPAPAPQPEPRREVTPAPAPAPMIHVDAATPPASAKPVAEKEVATEGRVLLRMFEQGAGPSIEIRWPSQAGDRDRLYDVFTQCLGMKVGLLDDQGHVYLGEGPKTQPMALNMDKYSGFVRRPEGAIAADEQQEIARIRAYHGVSAPSARMFPRRVDAYLLGGLRATVGDQYLKMKSVRAAYRLSGRRVMIDSITADGRALDGIIDLSVVASCN